MTNRQWLLEQMQNMSDEELAETLKVSEKLCNIINPTEYCNSPCSTCKLSWLKSEHKEKIELSDAERVILENVDKDYKWISRDKNGILYIYAKKPYKTGCDWWITGTNDRSICVEVFRHLFQFIKWEDEQAYNIEELLK